MDKSILGFGGGVMDTGYTYSTARRVKASLYVPDGVDVPDTLDLTVDGKSETFMRLSDRSLHCGTVAGVSGSCENFECHRRVLGECQCGRHGRGADGERTPVRFTKAVAS